VVVEGSSTPGLLTGGELVEYGDIRRIVGTPGHHRVEDDITGAVG
jgi:ABC-type phosphate transport system ATPase subunit